MDDPRLQSPVPGIRLAYAQTTELRLRYAHTGPDPDSGAPVVLFCHGWPESWYSWRQQLVALASQGYCCIAPDMRGYGDSDAPADIDQYSILHLVGDMLGLLRALKISQATVVGHDWGAAVAWHCALLRPDVFTAVVGMSVPWAVRGKIDMISSLQKAGISRFYMQYFQQPGIAEVELERDVRRSLRMIYFNSSGDNAASEASLAVLPEGQGFLDSKADPAELPGWLTEADLDWYAGEFARSGFRGGLNWYRNLRHNWELTAAWMGQPIRQPALFIAGTRDGVMKFPASQQQLAAYPQTLPGCRGVHLIDGGGHWIQRERAQEVSSLLLGFLDGLKVKGPSATGDQP